MPEVRPPRPLALSLRICARPTACRLLLEAWPAPPPSRQEKRNVTLFTTTNQAQPEIAFPKTDLPAVEGVDKEKVNPDQLAVLAIVFCTRPGLTSSPGMFVLPKLASLVYLLVEAGVLSASILRRSSNFRARCTKI